MEEELWKQIEGLPEYYLVSNKGRFMRKKHSATSNDRYLTPWICSKGYYMLSVNYQKKSAARLVAEAWVDNPNDMPVVKYHDGNKLNIRPNNLYWGSAKRNGIVKGADAELKIKRTAWDGVYKESLNVWKDSALRKEIKRIKELEKIWTK